MATQRNASKADKARDELLSTVLTMTTWADIARALRVEGKTLRNWVRKHIGKVSLDKSVIGADNIRTVFDHYYDADRINASE